jgi:hypothetical protein
MPIQFLLIIILLCAVGVTWKRFNQRVISIREAIFWTLIWTSASIVIILPNTTSVVANWLGVGRGADLVLYASVIGLFLFVFKLYISLDHVEHQLTKLIRREALRDLPKEVSEKK